MNKEKEIRLLFQALKLPSTEKELFAEITLLTQELDWDWLVEIAQTEGIASIVYHNLKELESRYSLSFIPGGIKKKLEQDFNETLTQNVLLYQELSEILKGFKERKIKAIVLKGAVLAETIYPHPALRPFGDLDLLIPKKDLYSALDILKQLAYCHMPDNHSLEFDEKFGSALFLIKRDGSFSFAVDLHWGLANDERFKKVSSLKLEPSWKRAKKTFLAGQEALVFSPEDLLIYLCLHLSVHHFFSRLIWFYDLAQLIKIEEGALDWDYLIQAARKQKISRALYHSLSLTNQLLGTGIPSGVLTKLRPNSRRAKFLEALVKRKILKLKGNQLGNWGYLGPLLLSDQGKDIGKVILNLLFPSPPWIRYRYPSNLLFAYLSYYSNLIQAGLMPFRRKMD